jgi:hypothetical protein
MGERHRPHHRTVLNLSVDVGLWLGQVWTREGSVVGRICGQPCAAQGTGRPQDQLPSSSSVGFWQWEHCTLTWRPWTGVAGDPRKVADLVEDKGVVSEAAESRFLCPVSPSVLGRLTQPLPCR